jgi:hypothetical protein
MEIEDPAPADRCRIGCVASPAADGDERDRPGSTGTSGEDVSPPRTGPDARKERAMSKSLVMLGSLVLGAAGGIAASLVAGRSDPSAAPASAAKAAAGVASPDLERIQRRLDELSAAVRSRSAAAPVATGTDVVAAAGAAPSGDPTADRLASVERRLAALEKGAGVQGPTVPENLAAVPSKELDALGRNLVQFKRYDDAQRVLKEVLGRGDLDEEERTEMEMQFGYALRGAGRFADAEARFLETLRRVGENTEKGAWVGFQAGWERYYQKDFAGASARMERSANAAGVTPLVRVHALYNAANFAKEGGDPARARALYERLLDNYAADIPEAQAFMRKQAEASLKEIRGY